MRFRPDRGYDDIVGIAAHRRNPLLMGGDERVSIGVSFWNSDQPAEMRALKETRTLARRANWGTDMAT